jgi:hypothetical protein
MCKNALVLIPAVFRLHARLTAYDAPASLTLGDEVPKVMWASFG